jgi:type II secretory pathway predicted ATPase ExeA
MGYYKILGLEKEPFSTSPDPEFFYLSQEHKAALYRLRIAVKLKRGLSVILGDIGTGKTTLARRLFKVVKEEENALFYMLLNPAYDSQNEFLSYLLELFGLKSPGASPTTVGYLKEIEKFLFQKSVEEKNTVVLLIDEAQKLTEPCLETLRTILNYETNEYKILQLILMSQMELLPRIRSLKNFWDRIALKYVINPLDESETKDMDIVDALKFLGQKGDINIIASKGVEGRVSLFLKDVSIKDALDIILLANNLAYEVRGEILYVMTEDDYKAVHGENFKDKRKVRMFKLKYAKPEAAFKALEMIKSEIGKLVVDEDSGSIVLMDTPEKLKLLEKSLEDMDRPGQTRVFSLQYAKAEDVVSALSTRLDAKKTGTIQADKRSNQVVVTALAERMKEVEGLIKSLDKKTKQVLLEARILKVILSDDFDMGVDWDKVWQKAEKYGIKFFGDFAFPAATSTFFKIAAGNDVITGETYAATVKILQEFGETRNLSSPSIAVIDGQEAKIMIGTRRAYVTTTIETGGTTATTAAQVQFVDVGVQLYVTPTINDEGFVTMKIKPEVSNVDSTFLIR